MRPIATRSLVRSGNHWTFEPVSDDRVAYLAESLGLSRPLARVLASRCEEGQAHELLCNDLSALASPFDFRGIDDALARIDRALERDERIFIHGDFDVDGLTSSAILYRALRQLGASDVKVELGDRQRGHGLRPDVIRRLIANEFDLLITTDCGISDVEEIRTLREHGIDTVVTDHHEPPAELPPARAIVNPRQSECRYPNAHLAAVGVIFQTVAALFENRGHGRDAVRPYLDLAMLGTVGDLVPLVRGTCVENRALVQSGLHLLAEGAGTLGLRVLIDKLDLDVTSLTAGQLSYIVIPKLNAANRVGDPRVAFLLLTTEDPERADYLADILIDYNQDRRKAQEALRDQTEAQLESHVDLDQDRSIVLAGEDWNPGVIGLVASDLVEAYHLPTILISEGDDVARASCRSIREFNMIGALTEHAELFERFGGHHMAAGFSIQPDRIPEFRDAFAEYAREALADLANPVQRIDAELEADEICLDLYDEMHRLGPFGMGNRSPRFLLRDATVLGARAVGSGGKHLKLKLDVGSQELDAIGFTYGPYAANVDQARIDVVFKLSRDTWNGETTVQLSLLDVLEPSAAASPSASASYL